MAAALLPAKTGFKLRRTTSPPTARRLSGCSRSRPGCANGSGRTGVPGPGHAVPGRRGRTTPTRSPRRSRRIRGSSTWTTIRSCSSTPRRCWPAARRAPPSLARLERVVDLLADEHGAGRLLWNFRRGRSTVTTQWLRLGGSWLRRQDGIRMSSPA
jgi:hypothetical protein